MEQEELQRLIEVFLPLKRQGPGSEIETLMALGLTGLDTSKEVQVLDIGSGTGVQTLTLAKALKGTIHAVDLIPEFLDELEKRSGGEDLSATIHTHPCSMDALPFSTNQFDLIWSEGALYNMGFEAAIVYLTPFLKHGGALAVSELSWFTSNRPNALDEHWAKEYPEVGLVSEKSTILEAHGYAIKGYFPLAESSWTEQYYAPLLQRCDELENQMVHSGQEIDPITQHILRETRAEAELYHTYSQYFGYGFYIAQKV